jgi:hypothetical protein
MDIEGNPTSYNRPAAAVVGAQPTSVPNPYTSDHAPPLLPGDRIVQFGKRLFYICISLYGLKHFALYQVLLRSPRVSHEWFKIGLATTIGTCVCVRLIAVVPSRMVDTKGQIIRKLLNL